MTIVDETIIWECHSDDSSFTIVACLYYRSQGQVCFIGKGRNFSVLLNFSFQVQNRFFPILLKVESSNLHLVKIFSPPPERSLDSKPWPLGEVASSQPTATATDAH